MVLRLAFKPLFTHSLSGFDRLVEFNSVGSSYRNGHETGSASRACIAMEWNRRKGRLGLSEDVFEKHP